MSQPFRFPKHPLNDRPDPFQDKEGNNPFADEPTSGSDASYVEEQGADNLYASPADAGVRAERFGAYETILPHRAGAVLSMGIVGCLLVLLTGLFCGGVALLALSMSLPAWILGQQDLRAMKAGAMDPQGRRATLAGWILGMIGSVLSLVVGVGHILWLVWWIA